MTTSRPSLTHILKQRQQELFIGRQAQIEQFEQNLGRPWDDPHRKFIFNVSGPGGVGKTFLLKHFRQLAEKQGALVAYTDESSPDLLAALAAIASQCRRQGQPLPRFEEQYNQYRARRQELETDPKAPKGSFFSPARRPVETIDPAHLAHLLRAHFNDGELQDLAFQLHIPYDELPALDKAGKARELVAYCQRHGRLNDLLQELRRLRPQLSFTQESRETMLDWSPQAEWETFVRQKVGDGPLAELLLQPIEKLTPTFLADLQEVTDSKTLVLLNDSYEETARFLDDWWRAILAGNYGDNVPVNLLLILAGQTALNVADWGPYEAIISRLPLEPFTPEEGQQYLAGQGVENEEIIRLILEISDGLPLLIATLAAGRPATPDDLSEPSNAALECFLRLVQDPQQKALALNGALSRYLNQDIVALLLDQPVVDPLFAWLKKLPFVQEKATGWHYHDVVRSQFLRYKRRDQHREWAALHQKLADYYRALYEALPPAAQKDALWQNYRLEELYHRLCHNPPASLSAALNGFLDILVAEDPLAHRWAKAMRQAGHDTGHAATQAWGQKLADGLRAYETENHKTLEEVFTAVLAYPGLGQGQRATALVWRGTGLRRMNRLDEALVDFNQGIASGINDAWTIYGRAWVYLRMRQYAPALADFDQAIHLAPDFSRAHSGRGEACFNLGRYPEALASFQQAIKLRPESGPWTFCHRGMSYRELGYYQKALDDFSQAISLRPTYLGAFTRRGEIYQITDRYQEALADFNQAAQIEPTFKWPLALRGLLFFRKGLYQAALADLDQAIERDPGMDWALHKRALVYQALRQGDKFSADLASAIRIGWQKCKDEVEGGQTSVDLAVYLLAAGESEEANHLMDTLLKNNISFYQIHRIVRHLDDYLALFPGHTATQAARDKLYPHIQQGLERD